MDNNRKAFIGVSIVYALILTLFFMFVYRMYALKPSNICMNGVFYGLFMFAALAVMFSVYYLVFLIFQKLPRKILFLIALVPVGVLAGIANWLFDII